MSIKRFIPLAVCAILLAACSSVPYAQRLSDRLAAYTAAAGAPVNNFRFFSLYSWEPLSNTELAVYTRPDQAWLLKTGGCENLQYVESIGLTSNLNQVSVRFDKVLTGRGYFPCTITQIRPVDVKRMKVEQQKLRRIKSEPRSARN